MDPSTDMDDFDYDPGYDYEWYGYGSGPPGYSYYSAPKPGAYPPPRQSNHFGWKNETLEVQVSLVHIVNIAHAFQWCQSYNFMLSKKLNFN